MKHIKLTHGTAMVADDINPESIEALNKLSVLAYNFDLSIDQRNTKSTNNH